MTERVYVALDLETTGLSAARDAITEVGAVRIQHGRVTDRFSTLVNPQRPIPLRIQQITGIRNEDVADAPVFAQVIPELLAFVGRDVTAVIAHNAAFDLGFLRAAGVNFHRPALDTFELAPILLPGMASYGLGELCRVNHIRLEGAHRALDDAEATANLFLLLLSRLRNLPTSVLRTVVAQGENVNWPPLLLFEDALRTRGPDLNPGPAPRTDLAARYGSPGDESGIPSLSTGAFLVDDGGQGGGHPPEPVDPAWIDRIFADDGPLAQMMGDDYELRTGQVQMAHNVLDAFNHGDHLLIEAGTGIGKSLAYLAPAALWSVANNRRVVIATNTIALQDQLVGKDIPQVHRLLAELGYGDLHSSLLKGRGNYLCTRRLEAWYRGRQLSAAELSLLAKVLVWRTMTEDGDVNGLFIPAPAERAIWSHICSAGGTCNPARCQTRPGQRDYYLEARQRADSAHILVINHALLMADIGAGERVLPPSDHLIVDEAHHLEDAATDQLTYRVSWPAVQAQLTRLTLDGDLLPALLEGDTSSKVADLALTIERSVRSLSAALTRFADMLRQFMLNHKGIRKGSEYSQRLTIDSRLRSQPMWSEVEIEWDLTGDFLHETVAAIQHMTQYLHAAGWPQREPQATLYDALHTVESDLGDLLEQMNSIILQTGVQDRPDAVTWMQIDETRRKQSKGKKESNVSLYAAPLHVGQTVEESLVRQRRTAIFTGATLRTGGGFGYIRDRLGLWDATAATVESPFDYERNTLLYMPENLPLPNHPSYQHAVEEAIIAAAQAAGGRTMALFTSYSQLRTTASAIRAPLDRAGITVLQHGTSSRNRLLREYRQTERAVLLGTRSFWEGIDLPGDQLSVLLIVKLPFAVPSDPLVSARSREFDNPFRDYTLPDAVLRFRQGFGRLIRSATDRGVVVLLDARVWQKQYGHTFLEALPTCTTRSAPLENLGAEVDLWLNMEESEGWTAD